MPQRAEHSKSCSHSPVGAQSLASWFVAFFAPNTGFSHPTNYDFVLSKYSQAIKKGGLKAFIVFESAR